MPIDDHYIIARHVELRNVEMYSAIVHIVLNIKFQIRDNHVVMDRVFV